MVYNLKEANVLSATRLKLCFLTIDLFDIIDAFLATA